MSPKPPPAEALELEDEIDDDEVTIDYEIATYPADYTLSLIKTMWDDKDIEIPDYQREFVWTIKQASLLIDSFLRGLPVPSIFLYIDDEHKNLVIDGQQRILSVVFFMEGYFGKEGLSGKRTVFRLKGIGERNPNEGKTFNELSESDRRKIKQSTLRAVNIKQIHPVGESTCAYHIFERLNTGGTPLKPQEIRNCVFRGSLNKGLKALNGNSDWRMILNSKYPDKNQRDVELLLRLFALYSRPAEYDKPMKEFLNKTMKIYKSGNDLKWKNFARAFPEACKTIANQLNDQPFHLRGRLNVSAMDSVLVTLIRNVDRIKKLDLDEVYKRLLEDPDFINLTTINTTDVKSVKDRLSLVQRFILGG
jgi:uncharacterized protein with ParB-like and HNH nuclease domain